MGEARDVARRAREIHRAGSGAKVQFQPRDASEAPNSQLRQRQCDAGDARIRCDQSSSDDN